MPAILLITQLGLCGCTKEAFHVRASSVAFSNCKSIILSVIGGNALVDKNLEMTIFLTLDSTNPNVGTESIALVCVNKSIILIMRVAMCNTSS